MQLLIPEVLEDVRGLSAGIAVTALVIGLLLWLFGWWGHRFWIVMAATVAAGVLGLYSAPTYQTQPWLAGLLLALAAGALALALVRLVAFAAGGLATWAVVHALAPTWNEPLLCVLLGGLVGLLLFRIWTMALTSLAGTLLMAYSGLCLASKLGNVDIVALAEQQRVLLNTGCGVLALLGLIVQFLLGRRKRSDQSTEELRLREYLAGSQANNSWWNRGLRAYRRAG
jgi:hypothetical protein